MKPYTFKDWWKAHDGMCLLWIDTTYSELYRWWNPRRYRLRGKVHEAWYYFKCLLWKRYSTVTPRDISPTWIDRGDLLLHTSFEILMQYVERESHGNWTVADIDKALKEPDHDGYTHDWLNDYRPIAVEIEFLYKWWTVDRPAREAEADRRLSLWHDVWDADRKAYTKEHPDWQKTDSPKISRWSLPEEHVEPPAVTGAWEHMNELSDEVRDKEDDDMLHRLIAIRHSLWT